MSAIFAASVCFEACAELMRLVDEHHGSTGLFEALEHERRPNTGAIAEMALENYLEMRSAVLDPHYWKSKLKEEELAKRDPNFISRFAKVMFHPEIPYRTIQAAR